MSKAAEKAAEKDRTRAQNVSLEQVQRVAELAQLDLTADEQTAMLRDLNSILGHVAQLNELDTTGIPPMAQVSEAISPTQAKGGLEWGTKGLGTLREDVLRGSLERKEVMHEAPETDGTYFKVPKVIER